MRYLKYCLTASWEGSSRLFFFFQAEDGIRDLTVTGVQTCALPISGRGQGVLLVDGNFTVAGNFAFTGMVIARGGLKMTGTGNKIPGAVMAASVDVTDNVALAGNTSLQYSSCAVTSALSASAYPKQAIQRAWVDMRSEEHTSELQSQSNLVCRLLLEKKNKAESGPPSINQCPRARC